VSVKVTATDGSGRVTRMEIVGEKATVSVSVGTFQDNFPNAGWLSSLFAVTDGPGATAVAASRTLQARPIGDGSPGFRPPVGPLALRTPVRGRQ
jgi:hypothetical protein